MGWTGVVDSVDVSFLNRWNGGPGAGEYILYARAVDPAGNTDFSFREGVNMWGEEWRQKKGVNMSRGEPIVVIAIMIDCSSIEVYLIIHVIRDPEMLFMRLTYSHFGEIVSDDE